MNELIELLGNNPHLDVKEIAEMLGKTEKETLDDIKELEDKKIIAGYNAVVNWEKTDREFVTALIEVKITPQRGLGFDKIAERIYRFSQVKDCFLMSGGFDLTVIVEGKNMKDVAMFVAQKLSVIEGVLSTATHFVLKKYKENNIVFEEGRKDDREAIVL